VIARPPQQLSAWLADAFETYPLWQGPEVKIRDETPSSDEDEAVADDDADCDVVSDTEALLKAEPIESLVPFPDLENINGMEARILAHNVKCHTALLADIARLDRRLSTIWKCVSNFRASEKEPTKGKSHAKVAAVEWYTYVLTCVSPKGPQLRDFSMSAIPESEARLADVIVDRRFPGGERLEDGTGLGQLHPLTSTNQKCGDRISIFVGMAQKQAREERPVAEDIDRSIVCVHQI
jgi:hypothetical protein